MEKINYNTKFNEIVSGLDYKPSLLLHVCCAPCLSAGLSRVCEHFNVTLYYYNPNISPKAEYDKRLRALEHYVQMSGIDCEIINGEYDEKAYKQSVSSFERVEGAQRCTECCNFRISDTAKFASENGYEYFGTTLTSSPLKHAQEINAFMGVVASKYNVRPLYSDFKKGQGGLLIKSECAKYGIYRQNYCGCTPRSLNVYITGGIASGKSVFVGILNKLGAYTINADEVSRKLYDTSTELIDELITCFPTAFIDNKLDRNVLKSIVFDDSAKLRKLNEITHNAIKQEIMSQIKLSANKINVIEVPLLFESGWREVADITVTISASESLRKERAIVRDKIDESRFESIVQKQFSDEQREALADIVVVNDGKLKSLEKSARELYRSWQKLIFGE